MSKWQSLRRRLAGRNAAWPLFFVYALLAVIVTLPLVTTLGEQIPGASGDAYVHLWTFHHVKEALLGRRELLATYLLFYPQGASLVFHTIAWAPIAFWLPVQALAGRTIAAEAAAYSLTFIAIFAFNGYAAYRLGRRLTESRGSAFIAGLIVAFWPYTLSHYDHPNLILVGFIPLSLVYLDRLLQDGRVRDAMWAGLLLGLVAITRWQLAAVEGLLIAIILLHRLLTGRKIPLSRAAGLLALSIAVAAIVVAPFAWPTVAELGDPSTDLFLDEARGDTDLAAYLIPSRYHPLWGDAAFRLYDNFGVNKFFVPFAGFTVLLLALAGAVRAWPRSRPWTVAAAIFVLLALGGDLTIFGRAVTLPMPYEALDGIFFVKSIRHPDRLNLILSVPVASLAALGLTGLKRRLSPSPGRWRLLVAAAAFLIIAEYAVRYETLPLSVPTWYRDLATESGDFAIATIPLDPRARADKENMYYQMIHGKRLVAGHVSRPSKEAFAFIESVPLLPNPGSKGGDAPTAASVTEQLRLLNEGNVRYLVLDKPWLGDEQISAWRRWLVTEPFYEDGTVLVYRTAAGHETDRIPWRALLLDDETAAIGLLRSTVAPTSVTQATWLKVEAVWSSRTAVDADYDVCIGLRAVGGAPTELACRPISESWPSSRWRPGEMVHGGYMAPVDPYLPSGAYTVTLSLAERGAAVGRPAPVGTITLDSVPRTFAEPDPATPTDAVWGNRIRLAGYDLMMRSPDHLSLTLHWQALRRMTRSYKSFVHLIDPAGGEIVAQSDTVPRNWSYPTDWWEEGEFVDDTIVLDLTAVPDGNADLNLFVGLYEPNAGTRLTLSTPDPRRALDNALFLQSVSVAN